MITGCSGAEQETFDMETSATSGVETSATSGPSPTTSVTATSGGGEGSGSTLATTTDAGTTTGPETGSGGETEGESTTTTGGDRETDEDLLRQAIAGELDPAQALQMIADSGGLPVLSAEGTYLFACLCGPGDWALTGDFNDWEPAAMATAGDLSWIEVDVPAPDGARYKLFDGVDYIADPMGRRYDYDDFGEYSLVRASAVHLERWYGVAGFGLGPRDLQVYVPADGAFSHVVYAADGQNLFDPEAIWGGWKLAESVPPEMLVVGVDNTAARFDEYTHTEDEIQGMVVGGEGGDYAKLVHEEIRPRMEVAYGEPAAVAVMGSSLGGLISFAIADLYPDDYDMVISMSGTVGWGSIGDGVHNPTILEMYEAAGKRSFAIYLDSGGSDGGELCVDSDDDGVDDDNPVANDNYCENLQLRDGLAALGYTYDVDLWHWWEPMAPHNEAAWAARVDAPLSAFAGI